MSLILFPATARRGFINRQARAVAAYGPEGRARTIAAALSRQEAALRRIGIAADEVADHVATLRREIEARLPNARRQA